MHESWVFSHQKRNRHLDTRPLHWQVGSKESKVELHNQRRKTDKDKSLVIVEALRNEACTVYKYTSQQTTVRSVKLKFHRSIFPRSILVTSLRGRHEDAMRKTVRWNLSFIKLV